MQDDTKQQKVAQDNTQRASQIDTTEPPVEELSDEALENVAGGCEMGTSGPGGLPPWIVPTLPQL